MRTGNFEILALTGLAACIVTLSLLVLSLLRSRKRSDRTIRAERALRVEVTEQADALDRLLALTTHIADDLDEGRVLERVALDACELVGASTALVMELSGPRYTVVTGAPEGSAWRPPPLIAGSAEDLYEAICSVYPGVVELHPLRAPSLTAGMLCVLRDARRPFTELERAQLRVFCASAARAASNARLFTLAETLRHEAEQRERERVRLSNRLLDAEEDERRRLALALHDGPQQSIAGIGLIVQAAATAFKADAIEDGLRSLEIARLRTRDVVRSLRTLTFALEPITLRDHGFTAAFSELAGQLAEAHGITIAVDASVIDAQDRQAQVCLYRIAQEATANAVKHAKCSHIDVIASPVVSGGLELAIIDNGTGVAEAALSRGGMHRGVDAMRERAWGVGGMLTFGESPGGGTTVRVVMPPRPVTLVEPASDPGELAAA